MNVVIIANIEWGFLKQRHQYIAEGLSKNHNVIFIESSAKRNPTVKDIPRIFKRLTKKNHKTDVDLPVTIITPIVFPSTLMIFRFINRMFFLPRLIQKIRQKLNSESKTVFWNYLPSVTSEAIMAQFPGTEQFYDCCSNFEHIRGMPRDTVACEERIIKRASAVIVDSDYLYKKHQDKNPHFFQIKPGVDFKLFNNIAEPENDNISKLLYFGLITSRKLNIDLINYLAHQGFDITLIGPIEQPVELANNVKCIPAVTIDNLPSYICETDALLLTYKCTEYTKGIIPAKFFECLATGRPIVASGLPGFLNYQHLFIYEEDNARMVNKIRSFRTSDDIGNRLSRVELARKHDWAHIISEIEEQILSISDSGTLPNGV